MSITLSAQTITTFDAPGGGTGAFQGTFATNINPSGTIIGFSGDANNVRHGFIRSQDGSFTIFDAPGAGTAAFQGTRAYATNPSGTRRDGSMTRPVRSTATFALIKARLPSSMRRALARAISQRHLSLEPPHHQPERDDHRMDLTRPS